MLARRHELFRPTTPTTDPGAGLNGCLRSGTGAVALATYSETMVGQLVQCIDGSWIARPPQHCPAGHPIFPGRVLVGSVPCSCGRHLSWECPCGAVAYGPALQDSCSLLHGPARVRNC